MRNWHYQLDLRHETSVDAILQLLLANRDLTTPDQLSSYFTPIHPKDWDWSHYNITQSKINQLRELLRTHKTNPILIYGDYDVDGITATAILTRYLQQAGHNIIPYIPSRTTDGYGLNQHSLKRLYQQHNFSLCITVDNGITAQPAIEWLHQNFIDSVVIDHHQVETLPTPSLLFHNTNICGSALTWGIIRHLSTDKKLRESTIQLAAMGTVCDVMELTMLNRSFVWHGLKSIHHHPNLAIQALSKVANINPNEIQAYHFGFQLGPRINAAGRLDQTQPALQLLLTDDSAEADQYAATLDQLNQQRQFITDTALQKAFENVDPQDKLILLKQTDIDEGIIGLIAGKLTEKYHRPSIVITQSGEKLKASCRSINTIDITKLLKQAYPHFSSVGGHQQAAGFTLATDDWKKFKTAISDYAQKHIDASQLIPEQTVDGLLHLDQVSLPLIRALNLLQPFGVANPRPTFYSKSATVIDKRIIGKSRTHLKLTLQTQNGPIDALAWNAAERESEIQNTTIDLAYTLDINTWNGQAKPQLQLKDFSVDN